MTDFTPIPQADLDAIRAREEAATEGPWELTLKDLAVSGSDGNIIMIVRRRWRGIKEQKSNARFAVHARTDQPRLRIAVEAAQAELAKELQDCCAVCKNIAWDFDSQCEFCKMVKSEQKALAEVEKLREVCRAVVRDYEAHQDGYARQVLRQHVKSIKKVRGHG